MRVTTTALGCLRRGRFPAALVVLLLALAAAESGPSSSSAPPDLVLVLADDLGYGDVGFNGAPSIKTPSLDRLTREGARLTSVYGEPLCSPGRAALLTGRAAQRGGVYTSAPPPVDEFFRVFYPSSTGCLSKDAPTIAETLKGVGYATAMVGKWHLGSAPGCLPADRGFDSWLGMPYSHEEGYPGPAPESLVWPPTPLMEGHGEIVTQPFNSSTLTATYTQRVLEALADDSPSQAPLFLHLAFEQPHVPLFVSPDFEGKSRRGAFGDAVEEMDSVMGVLADRLRARAAFPAQRQALLVFASDNGAWTTAGNGIGSNEGAIPAFDGGSNLPFRDQKGTTWEGGVRVPALAWWPGTVPAATVRAAHVGFVDIAATLLTAGGAALEGVEGVDLRPWLVGTAPDEPPRPQQFLWRENRLHAVRAGALKAHFITRSGWDLGDFGTYHDPPLLFDVERDPAESTPLDPTLYAAELAAMVGAAAANNASMLPLPPSQLEGQDWADVPCCDSGFDVREAAELLRAGEVGPAIWDNCVCF